VSLRTDPLSALVVPDGTTVEEHAIVTDGDAVVGSQSTVELGVRADTVVAGERASFGSDIEARGDCRLDTWCDVAGNVLVGGDAYLGERCEIGGQLVVAGDLDIGDDVDIAEGFEANGWIVIRNPVPAMVLLVTYLTHLLHIGEEAAAGEVVEEVFETGEDPLVVPRGASVSDDAWRVSTPARVGKDCRLHGNLRAAEIVVGERTELFGSLRAKDEITVDADARIHGDVTTRDGRVEIAPGVRVRGDVACGELRLSSGAIVEGVIRADETTIVREEPSPGTTDGPTNESTERAATETARADSTRRPVPEPNDSRGGTPDPPEQERNGQERSEQESDDTPSSGDGGKPEGGGDGTPKDGSDGPTDERGRGTPEGEADAPDETGDDTPADRLPSEPKDSFEYDR
jgi:predicted acyltransferase (DUF342 family)